MSEPPISDGWPEGPLGGLLLLLVVLLLVFHLGRAAGEHLTVAVGAIRLRPPTLVPLTDAETATAVGLFGGALIDFLAASEQEPTS
jgi:hypothetical protein